MPASSATLSCVARGALSCPCGRQPSVSPARSHNPRRDSPVPLHASLPAPPALTATHTPTTDTPTSRISSRSQNPICSACNTPPRQTGGHCDSFLVSRSAPFGQAGRFSAASRLPVGDCQHVWFHLLPRHADRTSYLRGGMSHPLFPVRTLSLVLARAPRAFDAHALQSGAQSRSPLPPFNRSSSALDVLELTL